jgi:hypothetical protein
MTAGSIVIDLLMRTGSFETDTKRASAALKQMEKDARRVGTAIGIAITAATAVTIGLIKSSIDAQDAMSKLAQKAGSTTEELSALAYAAELAGVNQDQLGSAMVKLSKNLSDAATGTGDSVDAFKALGIGVTTASGGLKSSGTIISEVATKFATFKDGAEKTAIAVKIFGKAGADLIPLLNGGAEGLAELTAEAERLGLIIDTDTARAAEKFNDDLTRVGKSVAGLANRITADLLPTLNEFASELVALSQEQAITEAATSSMAFVLDALKVIFQTLVTVASDVVFVFKGVGREIGGLAAQAVALASLDFKGFTAISDAMKEDAVRARRELDAFQRSVFGVGVSRPDDQSEAESRRLGIKKFNATPEKKNAPRIRDSKAATADVKKELDGQLKAIKDFATQQAQGYAFANRYVESVQQDGLISLREAFDAQKRIRDAALADQLTSIDKEISILRSAASRAPSTERVDLENKIKDAVRDRSAAVQKASQDDALGVRQEAREVAALAESYDELRARVFEIGGNDAAAAAIRNKKSVEDARKLISQSGGDPQLATQYEALLGQKTQLSEVQKSYNNLLEQARIAEEAIGLQARATGADETATLAALGTARQASLTQLEALAAKARELANVLQTPESAMFADNLANALERARLEVDPLADRIKDIGKELASAFDFTDAITGARSLKDVLRGIEQQILSIVTREIVTKPLSNYLTKQFGGSDSGGGRRRLLQQPDRERVRRWHCKVPDLQHPELRRGRADPRLRGRHRLRAARHDREGP